MDLAAIHLAIHLMVESAKGPRPRAQGGSVRPRDPHDGLKDLSPEQLAMVRKAANFVMQWGEPLLEAESEEHFDLILEEILLGERFGELWKPKTLEAFDAEYSGESRETEGFDSEQRSEVVGWVEGLSIEPGARMQLAQAARIFFSFSFRPQPDGKADPLADVEAYLPMATIVERFPSAIARTWYEAFAAIPVSGALLLGLLFRGGRGFFDEPAGQASAAWLHKSIRAAALHWAARGIIAPVPELGDPPDFEATRRAYASLERLVADRAELAALQGVDVPLSA
jgi:hypothetical protein